jgi:hypothetical protein
VNPTIDDIFRDTNALSLQLDQMDAADPKRESLLNRRNRLRAKAQALTDAKRHPASVENEIAMLEARLQEIDALFITKGYSEKHLTKGFSDPGAYSANINRMIDSEHKAEVADIEQRLADLRKINTPDDET